MTKKELIQLKEIVLKEKAKKENEDIDIQEILYEVLKNFTVTDTNGIYVCMSAFFIDQDKDQHTFSRMLANDSKNAEFKIYANIESNEFVKASNNKECKSYFPIIDNFEKGNIVLNPYNDSYHNGFKEVKLEFFEKSLEYGQEKSKQLILSKYPRL